MDVELRGNLRDFSLPDVIQLVGFGRKTGVLRVACGGGDAALYFEEGRVVHAIHPEASGEEAVFRLFHVPAGEFRFQNEIFPEDRTISMDPTNLVMEAARLLDESRRDDTAEGSPAATGSSFGEPEWLPEPGELEGDWFETLEGGGFEGFLDGSPDPAQIKHEVRNLLRRRFGGKAKRLLQAVDRCGDSVEELNSLAERAEKYIRVFLDSREADAVGAEIRAVISGYPPPTS